LAISLVPGTRLRGPVPRRIDVRLAGTPATRSITFDGTPRELAFNER
jgi:hypothetical protein